MKLRHSFLILFIIVFTPNLIFAQSKSNGEINKKIDNLVKNIVQSYKTLQNAKYRNTIAILDFDEKSKIAKEKMLGFGTSELLITRLSETGIFNIVDRKNLDKSLKEISLGMTGLLDENTIAQAGKMLGADIIVVGSISELGNYFNLNVRLIEVETGKILTSTVEEIEKWLLIKTTENFRPAKYRITVSGTLHLWNSDFNYPGGFISLGYNRELNKYLFFDCELGYGSQLQVDVSESAIYSDEYNHYPISQHSFRSASEGIFIIAGKLNYWLLKAKNIGFSSFTGIALINIGYRYSAWSDVNGEISRKDNNNFINIPLGISLNLYHQKMISFQIDAGYLYSITKYEKDFPVSNVAQPSKITASTSGIIFSLKTKMYF